MLLVKKDYIVSNLRLLILPSFAFLLLALCSEHGNSSDKKPTLAQCFNINEVLYINPDGNPVNAIWQAYSSSLPIKFPACIAASDFNDLLTVATAQLIEDGWVTARFGIPEQDLSKGQLKLVLVPGKLNKWHGPEDIISKRWQPALASKKDQPINLNDIEQTVEQLNTLSSQKADIQIVPSSQSGYSDLQLTLQEVAKPVRGNVQLSDTSISATLTVDHPFDGTDQFNFNITQSGNATSDSQNINADWSMGFGYNRIKLSARQRRNYLLITGAVETFNSHTNSDGWQIDYTRRLYRNAQTKIDLILTAARDNDHSYIDGTEIDVQARDQGWGQATINMNTKMHDINWFFSITNQTGRPNWWGDKDPDDLSDGQGTHDFNLLKLDLTTSRQWQLDDGRHLIWTNNFSGQHTNDDLLSANMFSIGGSSNLRQFANSLSAESGWHFRSKLGYHFHEQYPSEVYAAVDKGEVSGSSTKFLAKTQLVGWALGYKMNFGKMAVEFEIGRPTVGPKDWLRNSEHLIHLSMTGYL